MMNAKEAEVFMAALAACANYVRKVEVRGLSTAQTYKEMKEVLEAAKELGVGIDVE